jgi:4-diphosphocytidyl-2-C-methyl-D-erythritol kinase
MDFHSRSYGNPQPYSLTIHKHIPSPSGFGGASADAAALIAHLLHLSGPSQASSELLAMTSQLGADIPYFLQHGLWGEPAYLNGVGAQLQPVELPQLAGIVAVPTFGFSTAAMFGYFRSLDLPTVSEENPPEALQSKSALRLSEIRYSVERFPGVRVVQNDFELAAAAVFPKEAQILTAAQEKMARAVRQFLPGTWLAGLTGSGPALYAVTECRVSSADLKKLSQVLRRRLGAIWQVYPIKSHRPQGDAIGP